MKTWQLVINAARPAAMVEFWGPLLGYVPQPPPTPHDTWNDYYRSLGVAEDELDPSNDGTDGTDRLMDPAGHGPKIWFQFSPHPNPVDSGWHLDVYGDSREGSYADRKPLVESRMRELLGRGASVRRVEDHPELGRFFIVMADPEGNTFCLG